MKQLIYLFLLSALFRTTTEIYSQPSASFNFTTAFPVNEFQEFNSTTGFGGSMEIFFFTPAEKIPYGFGIELSYIGYGLQWLVDPYYDELVLSANKANNVTTGLFIFQIAPYAGSIRPYLETVFGGSYIFSLTEFEHYDYSTSSLWVDDWTWNYGAGIGLKFLASGDPFFNRGSIYLDLNIRYLFGTSATYLDRNSVILYGNTVEYALSESATDVITASIGFYYFF
jgi:hypothetical protein